MALRRGSIRVSASAICADAGGGGGQQVLGGQIVARRARRRRARGRRPARDGRPSRPPRNRSRRAGSRRRAFERDVEQPVDLRLGADIDAGGRILEHIDLAARDAASGRRRPSAGCRRRATRSAARDRSGAGRSAARARVPRRASGRARDRTARASRAAIGLRNRFSRIERPGTTDSAMRSAQTRLMPSPHRLRAARSARSALPSSRMRPPVGRGEAEQRPPDAFLSGAAQPDEADAPRRACSCAVDRPDVADRERLEDAAAPRPARWAGRRNTCEGSRPTISRITSSGLVSRDDPLADHAPVAQDHHAVGDLEHLVEPVRDVDHADAARAQPAKGREQARHLVGRQARRRLVEHQQFGVGGQRARDRHQRLLGAAQRLDARVGVDVGAELRPSARAARARAALQSIRPKRRG